MDEERERTLLIEIKEAQAYGETSIEAPFADVEWLIEKGLVERLIPPIKTMHGGPRTRFSYKTSGIWSHTLRLTDEGERRLT